MVEKVKIFAGWWIVSFAALIWQQPQPTDQSGVTIQDCTKRDRGISHVYNDIGEHVGPQRSVCDLCQL